jgi:hypothetical protein
VGRPVIGSFDDFLHDTFDCGCGCNFDVEYYEDANGYWQLSGVLMNFIAEKGAK